MKLLLDTCTFLWLVSDLDKLSSEAAAALRHADNDRILSSASAWEIGSKHASGKLQLATPPEQYVPHYRKLHEITSLPIDEDSTLRATRLPWLHKDPFDRMLIAQALTHDLTIVTPDPLIARYGVRTLW